MLVPNVLSSDWSAVIGQQAARFFFQNLTLGFMRVFRTAWAQAWCAVTAEAVCSSAGALRNEHVLYNIAERSQLTLIYAAVVFLVKSDAEGRPVKTEAPCLVSFDASDMTPDLKLSSKC